MIQWLGIHDFTMWYSQKQNPPKLKNFCALKGIIKKMKRQPTDWVILMRTGMSVVAGFVLIVLFATRGI